MKKILKNKVIIFIIAFAIAILQPVNGFLTVKASALPNPKPDLVVVPKPDSADIIDFATRTRIDAYDAKLTNMGKLSQNVDYGTAAAALEFAYDAAGLLAENGVYKDEYKARVQYIKDNSVLPAPLNNLESEIFFATLDYADMTIGYYMDAAGNRIGKGCIKFKEGAEKVAQAMLDAIKDTNYWSKPFKNIDGKTYEKMQCISNGAATVWYENYNQYVPAMFRTVFEIQSKSFCFYVTDKQQFWCYSKPNLLSYVQYNFKNGELTSTNPHPNNVGNAVGNGWGKCGMGLWSGVYDYDIPFPHITSAELEAFEKRLPSLKEGIDYDTSQTGISFMPAVVPATVPTSGKSFVDTDIETYVDGNKKLKPDKEGKVEIPTVFPQEVPFPEYDPEINPYVEPDTEIDPDPVPDPDPAPNPDPLPSADPQPTTNPEPAPDPDPAPNPNPLPSANPQPSINPDPEPEPDTETDLDVPSAIGKLDLLDRFPFCVPSDLIQGIKLFNATPSTPTWSWNLSVNGTPIQYTWVVSLDKFEKIAQLCRTLLTILFVWGLAKVTRYVIKG